jgi:undecaprenyl-diphosphatase
VNPVTQFDLNWFREIHVGWKNPFLDVVFTFFSYAGLGVSLAIISLVLLLFRASKHFSLPLVATILLSLATSQIPKRLMPRDRPSLLDISNPQEALYFNSFPSGHTTTSFACAFMIFFITFRTRHAWIGWLCLGCAFLVGLSRIYRGVHWPSDVIAGTFNGCATAAIAFLVLDRLGRILHLDHPDTTLTGREAEVETPASV